MVASLRPFRRHKTGFVQLADGYTAEYIEAGAGDPIVLVPGLAGGMQLLTPLIDELSQNYRVITYQLRGEERGLFERRFGFRQLVADLGQVIDRFCLERPGLIGVSFGGAIALEYATRHSSKLSFLAIQGATDRYDLGLFGDVARKMLDRVPLPLDNPFINQFFSVLIGSRRKAGDQFDFIVDTCWRTDQTVMSQRFAMLEEYDVHERIETLRTPTLVLGGERDVVVSSQDAAKFAKNAPNATYAEITSAGHLAFVTHAFEVTREIGAFATACD